MCMSFSLFSNDTPPTEIYTLSLHDALPISPLAHRARQRPNRDARNRRRLLLTMDHPRPDSTPNHEDRKSTRLNSSHGYISYAVFCLKKKTKHALQTFSKRIKSTLSHLKNET